MLEDIIVLEDSIEDLADEIKKLNIKIDKIYRLLMSKELVQAIGKEI